jgi:Tfp pilus assembly PilM family ATPase
MACVGVDIGALTVKVVALQGEHKTAQVRSHQGRPLGVLQAILTGADFANTDFFVCLAISDTFQKWLPLNGR